jgi:heme exporter protein C
MLRRFFVPILAASAALLATAPFVIAQAPFEATMGLVQKIFYFHVPCAMLMLASAFVCGIASAIALFGNRPKADHVAVAAAELTAVFGILTLITGPLWGRKAWGVWWQWDARLTSSLVLWLIFMAYLMLRRYGGPGSEKLSAGLALFGMANVPFVYWSVNVWRTLHPKTTVVPNLAPSMGLPFWWSAAALLLFYLAALAARARLEEQRAALDRLHLEFDEE